MNDIKTSTIRINGHAHLLPLPNQIPKFMREKEIFWISNDKAFMCQGQWKRPITDASFFLAEKLQWMALNHIDKEVILNLSQLYCNGYSRHDAFDVIRFQNDFNGQVQADYPDKFISGFVVQPLYIEDALLEIERCVNQYQMPLLCLPTHFLNKDQKWVSIADDAVIPIFELANHYRLAVEIHPYNAEEIIHLDDLYWRFHLIWMCAQTADAFHIFTLKDFPNKFPLMRTCFAHGNQFGQMGYGRRVQGYKGRPDLFQGTRNPEENMVSQNVFFDTIVHDVLSFELLIKRQGVSQIIAGIDDPYPLGEMETVPGCYPGKVIDEAVVCGIINETDRDQIWCDNVLKWLNLTL
ncbi:MAG: amidohydrolase family protein [Saprospiraceae bacterium]|nr:amidohydrolase family protein [Saprospiraceae bacterium]